MKTAKPRPRGRPKKFDEQETLDVITDVFWERGFAGTSLDTLSSATGVARPSLYAAFGDKEAMYLAGIRNFVGRIEAATSAVVRDESSLDAVLRGIFDVLIDLYTSEDGAARGCLVMCTAATEAVLNDEVRRELRAVLDRVDQRFRLVLKHASDNGELRGGADVKTLAQVLAGVTHTLALRARAGHSRAQLRKVATAAVALVASA